MIKHIKTEIIINASVKTVWEVLTDFPRYPEWNPFLQSIEGELARGKKLKTTMFNGDKKFVFKPVVKSVVPYQSFSWLGSLGVKGLFDGQHFFHLEEIGPSQVKLTHGEYFSGILSGIILKKIGNDTRTNFVRMNQALKRRAERLVPLS